MGVRYCKIGEKNLETSVFYPIDKVDGEQASTPWWPNQERAMRAFGSVFGQLFNIPWIPDFILLSFVSIKMPCLLDGELANRFSTGAEALRPIVFSHGLSGDKNFYMAVYHALAANGYFVMAINH